MKNRKIMLTSLEEVKRFVAAAGKCDFDIDVFYNRMIIDAKSILGVLSLDLTKELTVRMYGESREFEQLVEELAPENARVA